MQANLGAYGRQRCQDRVSRWPLRRPFAYLPRGPSADIAEGTIESINLTANTFNVGDKAYQWSSMNSIGPDLQDLNEGDEVKINYSTTHSGKNTVQRITLVKSAVAAAPTSAAYRPVSDDRLVNPEPQNWLLLRGNYQGWMYSPLDQINVSNVKDLAPVWSYSTGVNSGHEAPPIVNDGVMFVAAPYDKLIALNADERRPAVGVSARTAGRLRGATQHQARRRALWRQGLHDRAGCGPRRPRCQDRQSRLGERAGRRLATGLLHDHGAADRERQGHGRGLGRRVRRARLHCRLRCRERPAGMEDVHGSGARRARSRHLGRGHLAARRRLGLDDRHLRSREQPHLLGHWQRLALVRRSAARRQPLHLVDGRDRSGHR